MRCVPEWGRWKSSRFNTDGSGKEVDSQMRSKHETWLVNRN